VFGSSLSSISLLSSFIRPPFVSSSFSVVWQPVSVPSGREAPWSIHSAPWLRKCLLKFSVKVRNTRSSKILSRPWSLNSSTTRRAHTALPILALCNPSLYFPAARQISEANRREPGSRDQVRVSMVRRSGTTL